MRLLRQPQYRPYTQTQEVLLLDCALGRKMQGVPVEEINAFADRMLEYISTVRPDICDSIGKGELTPETKEAILAAADKFRASEGK